MNARVKIPAMTVTPEAVARVEDLVAKAGRPVAGLRVGVKKGGCAGMSYTIDYAEALKPGDEVIAAGNSAVIIDPAAILFLLGTVMDYKADKFGAQFTFENPNQTSACGCGESVAITPASSDTRPVA